MFDVDVEVLVIVGQVSVGVCSGKECSTLRNVGGQYSFQNGLPVSAGTTSWC